MDVQYRNFADTSDLGNVDSILWTGVEDNLRIDHPERFCDVLWEDAEAFRHDGGNFAAL